MGPWARRGWFYLSRAVPCCNSWPGGAQRDVLGEPAVPRKRRSRPRRPRDVALARARVDSQRAETPLAEERSTPHWLLALGKEPPPGEIELEGARYRL